MSDQSRSIRFYINGKEIESNARAIKKEISAITRELELATFGTEEYNTKLEELGKAEKALDSHKKKLDEIKKSWKDAGESAEKGLGGNGGVLDTIQSGLTKIGPALAGAFAIEKIAEFGTEMFRLATSIESMNQRAEVAFGQSLPKVTEEAKKNAEAMGVTTNQYIQLAATTEGLLTNMGFQKKETADLAVAMTNLVGPLSAWTGGQKGAAETSKILNDAMLGGVDALKELGISLTNDEVTARLASQGLDKLTGSSLKQAQAAATMQLVTEKASAAMANYQKGSEGMAITQAKITARFEEAKEKLATALIPVFHRLLQAALPVVETFQDIIDALFNGEKITGKYASVVNVLVFAIKTLVQWWKLLGEGISFVWDNAMVPLFNWIDTTLIPAFDRVVVGVAKFKNGLAGIANFVTEAFGGKKKFELVDVAALEKNLNDARKAVKDNPIPGASSGGGGDTDAEIQARLKADAKRQEAEKKAEEAAKKAVEARKKAREKELAELKQYYDNVVKLIQDGKKAEQEADKSDLSIKIKQIEDKYNAEIEHTRKLEAKGYKDAIEQRKELERLKEAEILNIQKAALKKQDDELAKIRDEARVRELGESQGEVEAIRVKYQDKIAAAIQLEKDLATATEAERQTAHEQTLALMDARDAEILAKMDEQAAKALEKNAEIAKQKSEAEKKISEAFELGGKDLVSAAEEQYRQLLDLANKYGIDTVELTKKFEKQKTVLNWESTVERLQIIQSGFSQFTSLMTQALDDLADEQGEYAAFAKVLALFQIAIDSAVAIAEAIKAAIEGDPYTIAVRIALAVGTIVAGMAKAKKMAQIDVPQKYEGGFHDVVGADDGKQYRARYIGEQKTGMLPPMPSLVLASERGPEYFVDNESLRNPLIADHVKMIEVIKHNGRVPQMAEGGYYDTAGGQVAPANNVQTGQPQPALDLTTIQLLTNAVTRLNNILDRPLYALLPDKSIVDASRRLAELQEVSGGTL